MDFGRDLRFDKEDESRTPNFDGVLTMFLLLTNVDARYRATDSGVAAAPTDFCTELCRLKAGLGAPEEDAGLKICRRFFPAQADFLLSSSELPQRASAVTAAAWPRAGSPVRISESFRTDLLGGVFPVRISSPQLLGLVRLPC